MARALPPHEPWWRLVAPCLREAYFCRLAIMLRPHVLERSPFGTLKEGYLFPMTSFAKRNGLSLTMFGIFAAMLLGQVLSGHQAYLAEQHEHNEAAVGIVQYLTTGHFLEALFENWESEFFQMAFYVLLTAWLVQIGSPESRKPGDADEPVDGNLQDAGAPQAARSSNPLVSRLYEHSLSLVLLSLWLLSFLLHAWSGARAFSAEQAAHGSRLVSGWHYFTESQFWFESFQNYQSEFLSLGVILVLGIYLREKNSPESKAPYQPHAMTGTE
jgi:hypothetical protein